jgi:hypothetical protein
MTAQTVTGIGPGSAEGPLRGYDLDNIRRVYINQGGDLLPCVYLAGVTGEHTGKWILRAVGDGQIKIDANDQVSDYFANKILPGTGIMFVTSPGPDKTLTINATGATDDHMVLVNGTDTTPGFLASKLVAGANITLTVMNPGGNETIGISATGAATSSTIVSSAPLNCPAGVNLFDAVYATITNDSVDKANATSFATAPVFGFVITKPTATTCIVAYAGEVTGFAGLLAGEQYYLDTTNGAITLIAPSGSGNIVQRIGSAKDATTLVVNLGDYTEL